MEGVVNTMADFLSNVGTFFTQAVTWMGDVLDVVVANPPLLILVLAMPICGFSIGILRRIINL